VKPRDRDIASPFALARRAVLADPQAAQAALIAGQQTANKDREPFTPEDAARAIARSLPAGAAERAGTALGRCFLWSRHYGGVKFRLTDGQYAAGTIYAGVHGAVWAGLRDDLTDLAEGSAGALSLAGVVAPRRHPPAHLGSFVASTAAELNTRPKLTADEARERRGKLWERYHGARQILVKLGGQIVIAVEELVIEDYDPWWVMPAPDRLGEREARSRAAKVFREREMLRHGLDALADFFGTNEDEASSRPSATVAAQWPPETADADGGMPRGQGASSLTLSRDDASKPVDPPTAMTSLRTRRERLPVIFHPGDVVGIDKATLAAAVQRMKREGGRDG
jgi:hypothetical protein